MKLLIYDAEQFFLRKWTIFAMSDLTTEFSSFNMNTVIADCV